MTSLYVSFNGTVLPEEQVSISPQDRGFRFGDGVFETLPILGGAPYLWQAHLKRLAHGLHVLRIEADLAHLNSHLRRLIMKNEAAEGVARVLVTRGCGSQGYLPVGGNAPTILLEVIPITSRFARMDEPGIRMNLSTWRRFPPACLPTDAKIMQGMNATLARMESAAAGYDEALLLSAAGDIAEAASGNLFWQCGGILHTPALSTGALSGITRARVMELWGSDIREVAVPLAAWREERPEAVFMTNSVRGAVPVATLTTETDQYIFPHSIAFANRCNALLMEDLRSQSARFR